MFEAFLNSWTSTADRLGSSDSFLSSNISFLRRMEEGLTIHSATRRLKLPIVVFDARSGKSFNIGHTLVPFRLAGCEIIRRLGQMLASPHLPTPRLVELISRPISSFGGRGHGGYRCRRSVRRGRSRRLGILQAVTTGNKFHQTVPCTPDRARPTRMFQLIRSKTAARP